MNCLKPFCRLLMLFLATATLFACDGDGGDRKPGSQTWFFSEGSALTDDQINSFDAEGLYYNVHSAANPDGEIRGQIIPASPVLVTDNGNPLAGNNLSTLLSGGQEVPANTSKATGYSTVVLDPVTKIISGVVVTDGIAGAGAHIHDGLPGVNGPIIVTLAGGPTVWTVPANTTLSDAQIALLTAGAYYINVHTTALPDGEIRGQLNQQARFALLSGDNEVPAVTTAALGTAVLALDPVTSQISGFIKSSGIVATAAHIHEAAAGIDGPIIVTLAETPPGSGIWVVPAGATLSATQVDSFNADNLYYNVHSIANPGGEIRGQILAATVKLGNATLEGANEVPSVTTTASGTGIISLNSITKQVSGNISTTGVLGTAAHVHEGAAGVNGPVIVPLTLTRPVSFP